MRRGGWAGYHSVSLSDVNCAGGHVRMGRWARYHSVSLSDVNCAGGHVRRVGPGTAKGV